MKTKLTLHSIALVLINVLTYWIASGWNSWTHDRHPSLAVIPLGAIVAIVSFLSWYHTANSITASKLRLSDGHSWLSLYFTVIVFGVIMFGLAPQFLSGHAFSGSRLLAFVVFQGISNAIVIAVAFAQRKFDSAAVLRQLLKLRWFQVMLLVATSGLALGCILAVVEAAFFGLNMTRTAGPNKVYEGEYLSPEFSDYDSRLGKKLLPNADALCRLKVNGNTVWNVRYTTDEFGRRQTVAPVVDTATKYVVFFGCSFLFGEGANDAETIPSQFAAAAPGFRAYNYGVPGYGTQQMLAKLQSNTIREEVEEDKGIVIYVYLEDVHEPRVIGGMQVTNSFGCYFPYYDMNADGKIQAYGNFTTGRPVLTNLYRLLGRSQTVRYFGLNFPRRTDRHFEIVAKIIEESEKECRQQLACEEFYVACFPRSSPHRRLIPLLESRGIKVLDYSELFDPSADGFFHKGDGHPTPLANHYFARQLAEDVTK